jgi:hypothetical protein
VALSRADPEAAFTSGFTADAQGVIRSQLALLDLADSAIVRDTHTAGVYRFGGRDEADAIIQMQADVTAEDREQSLAAVLDKVSGAELVKLQNKQARAAMETAQLEQLLVEQTFEREADAAVNNMRLTRMQADADEGGPPSMVDRSTDALTHWRLR